MKTQPYRGSHLPVLMKLMGMTSGPVLELGSGMYSTCYLHWACYPSKRPLVTYENSPRWFEFTRQFAADFHHVQLIEDWPALDLSAPWSIAFVDHDITGYARIESVRKLQHAEYVVAHDTENRNERKYGWSKIFPLFKYRWKYSETFPKTSVFSNTHDLRQFTVMP